MEIRDGQEDAWCKMTVRWREKEIWRRKSSTEKITRKRKEKTGIGKGRS